MYIDFSFALIFSDYKYIYKTKLRHLIIKLKSAKYGLGFLNFNFLVSDLRTITYSYDWP